MNPFTGADEDQHRACRAFSETIPPGTYQISIGPRTPPSAQVRFSPHLKKPAQA